MRRPLLQRTARGNKIARYRVVITHTRTYTDTLTRVSHSCDTEREREIERKKAVA